MLIVATALLLITAIAITIIVTTSGGGGGGGQRYPAALERRVISGCEAKGSPASLCECVVARLEESVSYDELITEGLTIEERGTPGSAIYEAVRKCTS